MSRADATGDATDDVLAALAPYFSPPIARAVLTSTLRRAKLGDGKVARRALLEVVSALEDTLPMYIADADRRGRCVGRLRVLTGAGRSWPPIPASPGHGSGWAPARRSSRAPALERADVVMIESGDDVAKACEVGRELARRVGFVHLERTKIATAISELARNIVLYAKRGEVRMSAIDVPRRGVEVTASDEGPGILDLRLVMSAAYRSRTGMGMGLKGAKRLMHTFDVESAPGIGTIVVARRYLP